MCGRCKTPEGSLTHLFLAKPTSKWLLVELILFFNSIQMCMRGPLNLIQNLLSSVVQNLILNNFMRNNMLWCSGWLLLEKKKKNPHRMEITHFPSSPGMVSRNDQHHKHGGVHWYSTNYKRLLKIWGPFLDLLDKDWLWTNCKRIVNAYLTTCVVVMIILLSYCRCMP